MFAIDDAPTRDKPQDAAGDALLACYLLLLESAARRAARLAAEQAGDGCAAGDGAQASKLDESHGAGA